MKHRMLSLEINNIRQYLRCLEVILMKSIIGIPPYFLTKNFNYISNLSKEPFLGLLAWAQGMTIKAFIHIMSREWAKILWNSKAVIILTVHWRTTQTRAGFSLSQIYKGHLWNCKGSTLKMALLKISLSLQYTLVEDRNFNIILPILKIWFL